MQTTHIAKPLGSPQPPRQSRQRRPIVAPARSPRAMLALALAAVIASVLFAAARCAGAAEIRIRPQATAQASAVRLGEVADIVADMRTDAATCEKLAALELFPAPLPDQPRRLRAREIQDILLLRGVNLAEHSFTGSSVVAISAAAATATAVENRASPGRALVATAAREAHRRVEEAVARLLPRNEAGDHASDAAWIIEFELTSEQARQVAEARFEPQVRGAIAVDGVASRVQIALGRDSADSFPLEIRVRRPPMVAMAVRAIGRGALVRAVDVTLAPLTAGEDPGDAAQSLDEVVGREALHALAENRPIVRGDLRSPLLVHRGEVVTVYARGVGIQVRVTARAREDGSLGDLIAVENIQDKQSFLARVCGARETEVFPQALRAEVAKAP